MNSPAAFTALGERVAAAARALAGSVVHTPVVPSPWWSQATGADVRLKLENVQHTGSFKLRGATFALRQLGVAAKAGVVAASSGNHGLGVAAAAARLAVAADVFVPSTTPPPKRAAIEALGARVHVHGDDCVDTERQARAFADDQGKPYVSPYNDLDVIAGQGTVMSELLAQWPEVELVYVAVGGGGLIAGMAACARAAGHPAQLIGCSPAASPAMFACVQRGAIHDVACGPTWSDSTAGGVEEGAVTFPLCRELVSRWLNVDEAAIAAAMRAALRHQHLLVEGAAGVALAACLADEALRGRRAAIVVCGGNLPFDLLQVLLQQV